MLKSAALAFILSCLVFSLPGTHAQEARELFPGAPLTRTIAGGEAHSYPLPLTAGQFVRVQVEQKGVDVVVELAGPDGKTIFESDMPTSGWGWESASLEAPAAGTFQLRVRALNADAPPAPYTALLEIRPAATADDRKRVRAERLLMETKLEGRVAATAESAIAKGEQALALWREIGDRYWEASTLSEIAGAYLLVAKNDRARDAATQALASKRELRDRIGEALALTRLARAQAGLRQFPQAIQSYESALAIYRELGVKTDVAASLNRLGDVYRDSGQLEKSYPNYEQSLALYRALKNRAGEGSVLASFGYARRNANQPVEALALLEQSLSIFRELGNQTAVANLLSGLGTVYRNQNKFAEAAAAFEQSLAVFRELKNPAAQATQLTNRGDAYSSMGQNEKARGDYEQALALRREGKDRAGEADMLQRLGSLTQKTGPIEKAIEYGEQALLLHRELKNRQAEARALTSLGNAYMTQGAVAKSIERFTQALAVAREVKDLTYESISLKMLGTNAEALGRFENAIAYYEQGLRLQREHKLRREEGDTLMRIGGVYGALGDAKQARQAFESALLILREVKYRYGEGLCLATLAGVAMGEGDYQKALALQEQALAIHRERGDRREEGDVLSNIALVHYWMGSYEKALEYLARVGQITKEMQDRAREMGRLMGEASTLIELSRYQEAAADLERASALLQEFKLPATESGVFTIKGDLAYKQKRFAEARDWYAQSLRITRELRFRGGEGYGLMQFGKSERQLGRLAEAAASLEQALRLSREMRDTITETLSLSELMQTWKARQQPRLAIFFGKQAVNLSQRARGNIASFDTQSQQSFLKSKEPIYRDLADLLIGEGRLPEAEQVIGLLKQEEYFEFIRRDGDNGKEPGKSTLTPEEQALDKRYREISEQLASLGTERGRLLEKKARTPEEETRLARLDADLVVAGNAFQKFIDQLSTELSASKEGSARAYQVRESQGLMEDLRELGAGTVALYTLVGEDKYRVILTTPDFQKGYEYPIGAADLNRKVLEFRQALQSPKYDAEPLARELYKILVGPVARDLAAAKATTVMWSLDGVLRYVPIAALHDGQGYLVERYNNVVFTPASQARLKDAPVRNWDALGLGVSKSHGERIPALPGVVDEMRGIIRADGNPSGALPGVLKMDEQFTQEAMLAELRRRRKVVHIASHFQFQPGNETNSALLLGDGSFLSLAQIKTLPNIFGGVELLTLSACNTATGGAANGKEVEGFGVLAQRQGAKAVVASLWPVFDASTKELMQDFYRLREERPDATKIEALRQAQLRLLKGGAVADSLATREILQEAPAPAASKQARFKPDPRHPYAHPYYWAPFILIGNWK